MNKHRAYAGLVTFGLISLLCASVSAGQLQDDYQKVVEKRRDLEHKRKIYEEKLDVSSGKMKEISGQLNDCIYKTRLAALKAKKKNMYENWRLLWESRLKEIEITRKSAEKERGIIIRIWRKLENVRRDLENKRTAVEKKHRATKDSITYESEFRNYMSELEEKYFTVIETELFEGYEDYLTGVHGYTKFLNNSLELCKDDANNHNQAMLEENSQNED